MIAGHDHPDPLIQRGGGKLKEGAEPDLRVDTVARLR